MPITAERMSWKHGETWYQVVGELTPAVTPVIVLHGGPGAAHNYCTPIAELIAQSGRAAVLYDQLGCGQSTHLPQAASSFWTPALFMEELVTLLRHLGVSGRYAIVGQSWGGMLAMQFSITQPAGLTALVVADSPASMPLWVSEANRLRALLPSAVEAALKRHEAAGTTDDPEYLAAVDVFYSRHVCRIPQPACVRESFAQITQDPTVYHTMNGPSEFHVIGSLKDWDITNELHRINVPTLLVSGAYDEATPLIVRQVHERIPGARWELFPDSSHMPHIEEPARFVRIVTQFLDANC